MYDLHLDASLISKQIEQLIRDKLKDMHRDGAIIAFSGGLDSTVTAFLTVRSLGKENVKLLYMPERDSNPIHKKHAIILAKQLGCEFRIKNITSILWKLGTYQTLRLAYIPTRYFPKSRK